MKTENREWVHIVEVEKALYRYRQSRLTNTVIDSVLRILINKKQTMTKLEKAKVLDCSEIEHKVLTTGEMVAKHPITNEWVNAGEFITGDGTGDKLPEIDTQMRPYRVSPE